MLYNNPITGSAYLVPFQRGAGRQDNLPIKGGRKVIDLEKIPLRSHKFLEGCWAEGKKPFRKLLLFSKILKIFRKIAWKKPFFKRVSSKISVF